MYFFLQLHFTNRNNERISRLDMLMRHQHKYTKHITVIDLYTSTYGIQHTYLESV